MESLISVIVPIYKVEKYLDRCVESIVNQTYKNLEIILVDDGSPDSCPKKCDEWAKKDKRIRVIHKKNEGIGFARNSGLDIAIGDYIAFVDSDDYISLDAIEVLLRRLESDNTDLVMAQKIKLYSDGTQELSYDSLRRDEIINKEEAFRRLGSQETPFPSSLCANLYRAYIFKELRFTNLKTAEDTRAVPDIINQCNKISIVSDAIYFYFQRDTSIVHTMTNEKKIDNIKALIYVARFLLDRDYINEARVYYNGAIIYTIKLNHDKAAYQLIRECFNTKERRLLGKRKDIKMRASILMTQFPFLRKLYVLIKNN